MLDDNFGEHLRTLMAERFTNISQLCRDSGISRVSMHKLLNGEVRTPRIDTLECIATTLGITLQELLDVPADDDVTDAAMNRPQPTGNKMLDDSMRRCAELLQCEFDPESRISGRRFAEVVRMLHGLRFQGQPCT